MSANENKFIGNINGYTIDLYKMILYHGSISTPDELKEINVRKGAKSKDFGQGFYLAINENHALTAGARNSKTDGKGKVKVYLYGYKFKHDGLNDLKIRWFQPNAEWLAAVVSCRKKQNTYVKGYDIVIGPTADYTVGVVIERYKRGFYNNNIQQALKDLKLNQYPPQVCVRTEKAAKLLVCGKKYWRYAEQLQFCR